MKFIDVAEIKVKAGDGGPGMSHFRREKFVPFGGPDGGDGGEGGDVIVQGDEGLSTLLDFRYRRNYEAKDGGRGGTNNRAGRRGEAIILRVPCGTALTDADSGELIGEILSHGSQLLVAKGGRGGVGNSHFASAQNQAPTKTISPGAGERKSLVLELKLLADVGIIGAPNAGKSTLVTVISAARPKVADYPFTTLVPTLGVVSHKEAPPFVVADVPGLIPGASEGKGLGHDFLRHIERTRLLVHLVDGSRATSEEMIADFEGILNELQLYNPELLGRPRITVISKLDAIAEAESAQAEEFEEQTENATEESAFAGLDRFCSYLQEKGINYLKVSAAQRYGISEMLDRIVEMLGRTNE